MKSWFNSKKLCKSCKKMHCAEKYPYILPSKQKGFLTLSCYIIVIIAGCGAHSRVMDLSQLWLRALPEVVQTFTDDVGALVCRLSGRGLQPAERPAYVAPVVLVRRRRPKLGQRGESRGEVAAVTLLAHLGTESRILRILSGVLVTTPRDQ